MTDETPQGKAIGGHARAQSLTPERRKEISEKALEAKAKKAALPLATHGKEDRPLKIGDSNIPCYVLSDGRRMIVQRGMLTALDMSQGTAGRGGGDRIAKFASTKGVSAFINNQLLEVIKNPILFVTPNGNTAYGYEATVLADLCDAVLEARKNGGLHYQQEHIAQKCEILVRSFAKVGIIALVDEATGYQKDRAKDALAKILEAFVAKELQPYVKKFPIEFYEGMFRLRGLAFNPESVKRPPYFGHLTNDVIYRRLAPGVWKELKSKVQKTPEGRPKHHLHRLLTPTVGDPRLHDLITKVTTIMQLSNKWGDFKVKLDQLLPAHNETMELPFDIQDDDGRGL